MYIYIYRERERGNSYIHICTHKYMYIYGGNHYVMITSAHWHNRLFVNSLGDQGSILS